MIASIVILCSLSFVLGTYGGYAPDEVKSLPGWSGDLPSSQYSGYLNGSDTTRLHYWFVESENDPANAPTVLWLNGGPGCSSLDGFFYEQGPFEISADFSTLSLREYRWTLVANMLYFETPVGVGFSYSESNDYACDDDRSANENRAAIENFFELYPEFKNNKFFITGESYAGVYVPTLAEAIVKGELDGTYTGAKLTGIAAGNGCSGTEIGICGSGPQGTYYEWDYLIQTPFVDSALKASVNNACNWTAAALNEDNALSAKCVSLLNEASAEIGNVNLYNIYGECVSDMCAGAKGTKSNTKIPARSEYTVTELDGYTTRKLARIIPHGPNACIDSGKATGYLNQAEVMAATHVKDPGFCWAVCNTASGWSYKSTRTNLPRDTYPLLVSSIQVLIYNGDWDACVPYTDGEGWTSGMGLPVKSSWHAWSYTSISGSTNQVAGYATSYDVSQFNTNSTTLGANGNSFTFITVKGGRHEVPITAPAQALDMLNRLIANTGF